MGSQIAFAIERKQSETALRERERDLNQSQKIAGLGSYKLDLYTETWVSSQILDSIFGIDEKYNKTISGWIDLIHPSSRESMSNYMRNYVIRDQHNFDQEFKIVRKNDGIERWLHAQGELIFDSAKKPRYLVGTVMDITDRYQMEEALIVSDKFTRDIINSIPVRVFWKDRNLTYLGCNKIFAVDAGFDDPKDIIGKDDYQMVWHEQAEIYRKDDQEVIDSGHSKLFIEEVQTNSENKTITLLTSKLPMLNSKNEITGMLGIYVDITDRKHTENEIRLKNEQLQTMNAEKDKFFSIIAHDLRGPLSAFVSATKIITEDVQTMSIEEIRDITESMKSSATNIYSLLENLLEWSRLRRDTMDFVPEKLNLRKNTEVCIEVLKESARRKGIIIEDVLPPELNILADSHMFETVIRNLVSNAIKFTSSGGKIKVTASYDDNQYILIKIIDSGMGMPPELIDRLFKINEKTNRPGTDGEPSTGLGLLLCKEFIEKNGGRIWVESESGKGSTFLFTLKSAENLLT
jgi:PAS domain S-box-containing protein